MASLFVPELSRAGITALELSKTPPKDNNTEGEQRQGITQGRDSRAMRFFSTLKDNNAEG